MADKSFGVKELNLLNASGTPTVTSPNNLNLNANTVAISTSCTIGNNLTVTSTTNSANLNVTGIGTLTRGFATDLSVSGISTISQPSNANPHSLWDVVNNSASAYRFTGPGQDGAEDNPNIYLVRGQRYIFKVNASGHPFQLRVANGGAAYSDGVTNNGAQSGNVVINVQHDAPAQLYYQCTNHGGMVGNIYIVGGPQVISGVVTATTFVGNLTGNVTGNATGLSGTPNISAGTIAGSTGTFTGSGTDILKITSTNAGDTGANLLLHHNSASPADNDIIGVISFRGEDDSGAETTFSELRVISTDVSNNSESGDITFHTRSAGTFGERVRIDSSGRIGVGVVPTAQFAHNLIQIGHQATLGANAALSATGQTFLTHNLYFDTGGTFRVFNTSNANEGAIFRLVDGQLLFSNSAATTGTPTVTERLRINSAGNLTQTGSGNIFHYLNTGNNSGDNSQIAFGDTADADAGYINYDHGTNAFQIRTNGASNSVTITNEGEMQLSGDANPVLSVNRGGSNTTNINIKYNGSTRSQLSAASNGFEISAVGSTAPIQFFANGTEKVRIPAATWGLLVTSLSSTGNTGGYQTEGVSLRTGGDSTFVKSGGAAVTFTRQFDAGKVIDFYSGTTYAGGIYVNGSNNTALQQGSDYRLKTDITSMTDGINKVKQLNPIYYKANSGFDTTTVQNGFLAHEVQSVLPTLVDGEKDAPIDEKGKGYQTLNYAGFTPTAIAAIKELIAKVETLEAKVAALEGS